MSIRPALATFLALTVAAPIPAFAQTPPISIDDALKIVRANGLVTVTQIELDDGEWEAEGRNAAGARMEIDLEASTGAVLRTETH